MSSRVGTAIPASRSTAWSSSVVGFTRSIQTAFSGNETASATSTFFREGSEGTYTDNMDNSGNRADRTGRDSGKRLMTGALTPHPHLWRWGGGSVAVIRQQRQPRPKINLKPENL